MDEPVQGEWWRYLIASGIAGATSRTATAPFDRLKVSMQIDETKVNMRTNFKAMLADGGIKAFWRGNLTNVLKVTPDMYIKFSVYKRLKVLMEGSEDSVMTFQERFTAGIIAGSVSQSVVYPMDLLKTRLMLRKTGQFNGMVDAVWKIYAQEGIRSFYRGYLTNLIGTVPMVGVDFAVYETVRSTYFVDKQHISLLALMACGCISAAITQFFYFPFNIVKTQLQVQESYPVWTIREIVRNIIKKHGIFGMYQGLTASIFKIVPTNCISFVVFEYSSKLLSISL